MTREEKWLVARCGRPTSSGLPWLFTGGSRPMTESEVRKAELLKDRKRTVKLEFGDTAINYMYALLDERITGWPTYTRDNFNFEWGKRNEPYGVDWLRANTLYNIKHCADESEFKDIVFCISDAGAGDSPDFYGDSDVVGEIKCPVSRSKFLAIKDMGRDAAKLEYELQLANHFNANHHCNKLIYFIYCAQNDDNKWDTLDPLDPSRGCIYIYERSEFSDLILEIEEKVARVVAYLDLCQYKGHKVCYINDYYEGHSLEDAIKELKL